MTDEQASHGDDPYAGRTLEVRRVVEASVTTAFDAWTRPGHVATWWRPTATARCTRCEIDLRVGGRYRLDMHDPADGTSCEVEGEFREIARPSRLVYTWNAKTHEGTVRDTLVTVEFHRLSAARTEVVVRHDRLPDAPIADGHRRGWEKMVDSYAASVRSRDR